MSRTLHAPRPQSLPSPRKRESLVDVKWLPIGYVAALLPSYSQRKIYGLARSGELEWIQDKPGAKIFISERSVEAFFERIRRPAKVAS